MSNPREMALQEAKRLGVEIEISGQSRRVAKRKGIDLEAWSPGKTVFAASGGHVIVANASEDFVNGVGSKAATEATWKSLLDDLKMGVQPCENADCDRCDELDDDG